VTRAAGRALAAAILAALLASVLLAAFYLWHPALTIEFDADPPLVSGVYPVERDVSSGLTFAWTGQEMRLSLPGLDRRVAWNMDVRVRGARRQPADNPDVVFVVDGAEVLTRHTGSDFEDVRVAIPARPERPWGALVAVRSSSTFVPGPADPRPLGVMLDRLAVVPDGAVLPPRPAFAGAAIGGAALAAAIALLGVTAGSAIVGAALLSTGEAAVIARGSAPFTELPFVAARLAVAIAFALAALGWLTAFLRRQPLRNTARFAMAFSAAALFLKLLVLLHPDSRAGSALLGGYRFGDVRFRIGVCSLDAIAGLLLYRTIVHAWGDRLAGALAVALYQFAPLAFALMVTGHVTAASARALAVVAIAILGATALGLARRRAATGLAALTAAALTGVVVYAGQQVDTQPGVRLAAELPLLLLAVLGADALSRSDAADPLTRLLEGWILGCAVFLVAGIFRSVGVQSYLTAVPAIAAVAAFGAARRWSDRPAWRTAVAVLLAGTVWIGIRGWWTALG